MADEFDERREEMSEIQRLIQELKDSIIGFENYKKYFEKVKSSDAVLITQINNRTREYEDYKQKFLEATSKDSFKQLVEDGFVTTEVFNHARMMNRNMKEAFNWKTLQEEMYSIIFKKIFDVLDDARALDIKRDALKEMKEMEERRQAMFIEIMDGMSSKFHDAVTSKLKNYDEKLFNLVMMNDEEHRKDRREIFNSLKELIYTTQGIEEKDRKKIMNNFGNDESKSKFERMFPTKPVQTQKPNQPTDDMQFDGDEYIDEPSDEKNNDIYNKFVSKPKPNPRQQKEEWEDTGDDD